jgi:zinc protease
VKQQERPAYIAQQAFYQALYGRHPYAHLSSGSIKAISALTVDDVKQFYQQYYGAKNAVLVIVGDLTEMQAKHIAEQSSSLNCGCAAIAWKVAKA